MSTKGIIEIGFGRWGKFGALQLLPSCFRVTFESREIESNSELSQVIGDEHVADGRAPAKRPQTDVHPGAVTKGYSLSQSIARSRECYVKSEDQGVCIL